MSILPKFRKRVVRKREGKGREEKRDTMTERAKVEKA